MSNVKTWELFQACGTQWRFTFGERTGLDYNAMGVVAKILKIKITKPILQKIQFLEMLALESRDKDGDAHES